MKDAVIYTRVSSREQQQERCANACAVPSIPSRFERSIDNGPTRLVDAYRCSVIDQLAACAGWINRDPIDSGID